MAKEDSPSSGTTHVDVSVSPVDNVNLIMALEKQTAALMGFTVAVLQLTQALGALIQEAGEAQDAEPETYLNGNPIKR